MAVKLLAIIILIDGCINHKSIDCLNEGVNDL